MKPSRLAEWSQLDFASKKFGSETSGRSARDKKAFLMATANFQAACREPSHLTFITNIGAKPRPVKQENPVEIRYKNGSTDEKRFAFLSKMAIVPLF
jgi:hypothetical protein